MRFHVCAVGRKMPDWVDAGFTDYARRMPGGSRLELHAVATAKPGAEAERGRADEARRLRAAVPKRASTVALDRGGKPMTTEGLAERAEAWNRSGAEVAFLIGGAEGLDGDLLGEADARWSLGGLTLPHGLVRVVLAEQLYRALSILHNHPYHRS